MKYLDKIIAGEVTPKCRFGACHEHGDYIQCYFTRDMKECEIYKFFELYERVLKLRELEI